MSTRWIPWISRPAVYSAGFVVRVVVRLLLLLVAFNALYLTIQPLNRQALTLYNTIFPGRLRLAWTDVNTLVVNEVRLPRLIADHAVSRPKQPNEYRAIILGSSDVWGYLNRPQETMPVVLDSMGLTTPDGRVLRSYNLSYVN